MRKTEAINRCRKQNGLPPIRQGKLSCLKCEKLFLSEDKTNNRLCKGCK